MYLVTTPLDKGTGADDVHLGPWCRTGTTPPRAELQHPLVDVEEKRRCNQESRNIVDRILPDLGRQLNEIHGTTHSDRYWKIICQRWLLGFIDVVYQRWNLIDAALKEADIKKAGAVQLLNETFAPRVSQDLVKQRISHEWNSQLFGAILDFRGIEVAYHPCPSAPGKASRESIKFSLRNFIIDSLGVFARRSRVFVGDSYLPALAETILALRLRSIPIKLRRQGCVAAYSTDLRGQISLTEEAGSMFEQFVRSHLSRWIPMSWVEDFGSLTRSTSRDFPRCPRSIYTANAHLSDDRFILWSASCVERGSRLILSQHGGLYGEGEIRSRNEEHELDIADLYVTWGWRDPAFGNIVNSSPQITQLRQRKRGDSVGSNLLVVLDTTFRYSRYSWETCAERDLYLQSNAKLVASLREDIRSRTVVRFHHDHDKFDDGHAPFFQAIQGIRLDNPLNPIAESVRASRLTLVTTLSTTFIENLWTDTPTLIFASPHIYELREEYKYVFEELRKAGIYHESPESVCTFVAEQWDSVEDWWSSALVRSAIRAYGKVFGGFPTKSRQRLVEIIRGANA